MKVKFPLYLVGFMASGKTALGKKLARELALPFYDLDEKIEKKAEMSISQIFQEKGETSFRKMEQLCLAELKDVQAVVSLGGGAFLNFENEHLIRENGTSIFLDVEADILIGRLRNAKINRPLIASLNAAEIAVFVQETLASRRESYEKADYQLKSNNPTVKAVLKLLEIS